MSIIFVHLEEEGRVREVVGDEVQVAELVKQDRLNRLNRVVNQVAEERAQRFLDRDLEVCLLPKPYPWPCQGRFFCRPILFLRFSNKNNTYNII